MRTEIDFADSARAASVPRHGWAKNSQGVKLLWLPILRLVHNAPEIRKSRGIPHELSQGQWAEIRAFDQVVRHFALVLRELAKCIRVGRDPWHEETDEERRLSSYEASSLVPLHTDLAFTYARRLADHFARASRYALFKNFNNAPREYKRLRLVVSDTQALGHLTPLCDAGILREAFECHSKWLDKLRDSTDERGESRKGIRDIMEHHPIAVVTQHSKGGDGPWELTANLGEPGLNPNFTPDLLGTLKEIVSDMAALWTKVCAAAGLQTADRLWIAPYGDALLLTGNEDDRIAFWPESTA